MQNFDQDDLNVLSVDKQIEACDKWYFARGFASCTHHWGGESCSKEPSDINDHRIATRDRRCEHKYLQRLHK